MQRCKVGGSPPMVVSSAGVAGGFYAFITVTFIANAEIGFHIPWTGAYVIGICAALAYVGIILWYGKKRAAVLIK